MYLQTQSSSVAIADRSKVWHRRAGATASSQGSYSTGTGWQHLMLLPQMQKNPPNQHVRRCTRATFGWWGSPLLQGLLHIGSPATHMAWGGTASAWEPRTVSKSHFKRHLKAVPSFQGCDAFPRKSAFPVGQLPAACKLIHGAGRGWALQLCYCSHSSI